MATMLPYALGDIRANREGLLSMAQRARLAQQLDVMQHNLTAYLIEFGVLNAVFLAMLLVAGVEQGGMLGTGLILSTLMLMFERLAGARARKLAADVAAQRANVLEGMVKRVSWLDRAGIKRYGLRIGQQVFVVAPHIYAAIDESVPYRVYFTPRTRTLLSMEMVSG